jgi:replicative DNA helicase
LLLASNVGNKEYQAKILDTLSTLDVSEASTEVLIKSLVRNSTLKELSLVAYDITEGRGSQTRLEELLKSLNEEPEESKEEFEFVTDSVRELLNETYVQHGLRWRLNTLNRMLGSLRGGDFGFVFARPETGKTTFLASEVSYMAEQLKDDDGPILWFNNEEKDNNVKLRCIQASLGTLRAPMIANPDAAERVYLQKTKGKLLLLKPPGSIISRQIAEAVVRRYKPRLIVFDQIDKITGFEADREDLKLGAIYQWARELAKGYNASVIGICQADGTGDGQRWLTMNNVANAKTSKQAEADWILGIGTTHDTGYERLRYLHLSKNKLSGDTDSDPALRHGKCEVLITPEIARYEDIAQA